MTNPLYIELIGPAGAGKTTLIKALVEAGKDVSIAPKPSLRSPADLPYFLRNTAALWPFLARRRSGDRRLTKREMWWIPSNAVGATVTDIFSTNTNIATANWTCLVSGGATCTAGGFGDLNDTVNVPVRSTLTYTVTATIVGSPLGNLVNTASVSEPAGTIESNNGNDSATDTNTLTTVDPLPGSIGTTPDGIIYNLMSGGTLTLPLTLVANGDSAWDLVYYELPAGSGVLLDWMVVEIGDGNNWYTVFNWGNNVRDLNTNMDFAILSILVVPPTPEEVDQRDVAAADLARQNQQFAIGRTVGGHD